MVAHARELVWFALGNAPKGSSRGTGGIQGSSSKGLQTLHPTTSLGWQLPPTPGSQESAGWQPCFGVMILLATSSCLNPFQSCWVLPSAFRSTPGPCWQIFLHIARINELRRDACPGTTASPSVCPLPCRSRMHALGQGDVALGASDGSSSFCCCFPRTLCNIFRFFFLSLSQCLGDDDVVPMWAAESTSSRAGVVLGGSDSRANGSEWDATNCSNDTSQGRDNSKNK